MKKITVYCGSSSGTDSTFREEAFSLGKALADSGIELIYGGAKVGLMGAVADGVLSRNGSVIGILPRFLAAKELQHEALTEIILVNTMHERKQKMSELADGFIALPGGFGTMEELFEMLTWAQLALHKKPVAVLNVNHYYDSLFQFIDEMINNGFLKEEYRHLLLADENAQSLLQKMESFKPLKNDKWFVVK